MSRIVANLVVSKDDGTDDGSVVMELDDILNDGETSFSPGDDIYFLIHHDSTVTISWVRPTDGQVVSQGHVSRDRQNQLLWVDADDEHELSYVPSGSLTPTWYGNTATGLRRQGTKTVIISSLGHPALCDVDYSVSFSLFRLLSPSVDLEGDETYPVTIVARMENT